MTEHKETQNKGTRHKDLALENVLRTWRLMAPRTSVDMERARKIALIELTAIDANLTDMDVEKAIMIRLRENEDSLRPRKKRTRQEKSPQDQLARRKA